MSSKELLIHNLCVLSWPTGSPFIAGPIMSPELMRLRAAVIMDSGLEATSSKVASDSNDSDLTLMS